MRRRFGRRAPSFREIVQVGAARDAFGDQNFLQRAQPGLEIRLVARLVGAGRDFRACASRPVMRPTP